MKRKWLSLLLALAMVLGMMPVAAFADDAAVADPITVFLTVSDKGVLTEDNGGEPMAQREVTVMDLDSSGDFTVDEALIAAHKAYNKESGYATGTYGVTKLWGTESSNLLFFVNNKGLSLGVKDDKVRDGDFLTASINADNSYYADWYTYFDKNTASAMVDEDVILTLSGFQGMAMKPSAVYVTGAAIQLADGTALGKTDNSGKVTVSFDKAGTYVVTASGTVEDTVTDWNLMNLGGDPAVYGTMDFETYESSVAYTEKDHGAGPYPASEVKFVDFWEWNDMDEEEQAAYHTLQSNSLLADCPLIAPACVVTVTENPAEPDASAFVRIVGADNEEYLTWTECPVASGKTTLKELTEAALAQKGASAAWSDYGFLNSISGCDINGDYWMSMLNDSGDAFNTGNFDTITAKDGDRLVLYAYGNGDYAWMNAKEVKPIDVMEYEGWEYITGSGTFAVKANSYDESWNLVTAPVEGAAITVTGLDKAALGDYDVSAKTAVTDANGVFSIDFYGNCAVADLDTYQMVYELYAEKDGMNTAFCRVVLTKDGLMFSQPEGDIAPSVPETTDPSAVNIDDLLEGISATYTEETSPWIVMEMAAYKDYKPSTANQLAEDALQTFINNAAAAAEGGSAADTDLDKLILALQANGYDPQKVYPVNSNDPIDLIESLNGVTRDAGAWNAPYTLAAYAQGDYGTEEQEKALISAVLAAQKEDGSWEAWGSTVDATANMIAGLAFHADDAEVKAAIDKAVEYLAAQQKEDGTYDSWGYGADANTAAIVVIGLCAAGVDPAEDARFVKNGVSALDGLKMFALADNSGFGYQDNQTKNASATEQGFRALIAVANVLAGTNPYNFYDFSGNSSLEPARASGSSEPVTPADPTGDNISVTVTVKAKDSYWLDGYRTTVPGDGATAYYVLTKAFDANSIEYKVKNVNYIYELTYKGTSLGEFDDGPNSGWLYKVNSTLPTVGTSEYAVKNGDTVTFYYTEDWTKDSSAMANVPKEEVPAAEQQYFCDVENSDWYDDYANKAAEEGLFAGYAAGTDADGNPQYEFRGSETMTRAMFVTVLRAMESKLNGAPAAAADAGFSDVEDGVWYEAGVNWAVANGIAAGKGEVFGVDDPVTREQMAVFFYLYASKIGKVAGEPDLSKLDAFSDADKIAPYAKEAMAWLVGEGLMAGRGSGRIAPAENSTRSEVAVFLVNCFEYLNK